MKQLDIKRALAERDMTQAELCKRTGILSQNMRTITNGNPTLEKLIKVAEGMGCAITDPVEEDVEQEPVSQSSDIFSPQSPADIEERAVKVPSPSPTIETATFCPHCGKKVRVGVVLLPEE